MLSYQHIYHAGNRADVLKHAVLAQVLSELKTQGRPVFYVETHAGRGLYDLTAPEAQKGAEYPAGIGALMNLKSVPAPLQPYLSAVQSLNKDGELKHYPGSPWLASHFLGTGDRITCFELHPTEHTFVSKTFEGDDRVLIRKADGYRGALTLAPRAKENFAVLVDPSYETLDDLKALIEWVPKALRRWPKAVIMIWLPLFKDGREDEFGAFLAELESGAIAGARWPDDPSSTTALAGTAMISYRVSDTVVDAGHRIAEILENLWAQT